MLLNTLLCSRSGPIYAKLVPQNSAMLPACFTLKLSQPTPLCAGLAKLIHATTEVTQRFFILVHRRYSRTIMVARGNSVFRSPLSVERVVELNAVLCFLTRARKLQYFRWYYGGIILGGK